MPDTPIEHRNPESFMRRAIELSRRGIAAGDGGPFGAVVVKGGQVIGEGWNRVLRTNDPTAHGEIVAIRNACRNLKTFSLEGSDLYTTGEPCPMCLAASYWARITRIYYGFSITDAATMGFDDDYFYREISKPRSERLIATIQLLPEESLEVAKEYLALPDRRGY